jgi:hypothetical protein
MVHHSILLIVDSIPPKEQDLRGHSHRHTRQEMRLLVLINILAASTSVLANGGGMGGPCYPRQCGWQIVNGKSTRFVAALVDYDKLTSAFLATTQSDIARLVCGRDDTCNGKEWNTIFSVGLSGSYSAAEFCEKGCYRCKGFCGEGEGCCH